jgi:hypothetical protein
MKLKFGNRMTSSHSVALRALTVCAFLLFGTAAAHCDPVLDWNVIALQTTAAAPFNPPLESRSLAIVHAAIFDAVNSITGEFHPYAVDLEVPDDASAEAAAVAAAHFALVEIYSAQKTALDAAYIASMAEIPDSPSKAQGIVIGETVAARILARRANDGVANAIVSPYTPGTQPGDWIPAPPALRPALDPGWGNVLPFFLREGSQFRPGPPPALTSAEYARDFNEIKEVGSANSGVRTPAQTELAKFWISTGPQIWNPAARQMAIAKGLTLSQNARLFALLNMAGADAFIAAWDAKYRYNQWRPITAIRAANSMTNPDTVADPAWTPLLTTPPFPDYIAGHTTFAGAAEKVLEHVFGTNPGIVMQLTSAAEPGVVETYSTFDEIAAGVVEARVLAGIHWRTSSERGRRVGQQLGAFAVRFFLTPNPQD